ncbi:MAG: peptidoglycan DD-metalloendopeptidase family protein [Parvularculaceae bacterium]
MTEEFVHTGQTFTGEGDAYCPLERKRRGPAALAAALTVLLAGGAVLTLAALSVPAGTAPQTPPVTLAEAEPAAPETAPEPFSAGEPAPVIADEASIAEALAESRAARASLALDGGEPVNEAGFAPSLKPEREGAPAESAPQLTAIETAPPRAAATISAGAVQYASASDDPPPFFFESDIEQVAPVRVIPALAFAGDMTREPGELRIKLNKGENFVEALKRAGVDLADANAAAYAFGKHQNLRRIQAGQEFALTLGWPNQTLFEMAAQKAEPAAKLLRLEYRADAENRITLHRESDGTMEAEKKVVPLTTRIMSVAGQINGSLYLSAKHQGAPDETIANLANAFAYDVDFQREIFGGDEYEALFEVQYDDRGKLVTAGDILYARLKWRGRQREKAYYRFTDASGFPDFYDVTGQSAKRLLMKTPIDGARLSSGFGTRKHPILGYQKAHKGVDFAAPRGTPIKAAGDGVIERADRYGSFGNYVKIRHANNYQTAYAHLNGFARNIRKGARVRQGDIIGYVGTTGRSTGPHLHYEVHLKGVQVNPQNLKIATGKELTGKDLERFKAERARIDAMRMAPAEREALYARDTASKQGAL